jgi:uncharacterized cupredoxin-like copper-binding protein
MKFRRLLQVAVLAFGAQHGMLVHADAGNAGAHDAFGHPGDPAKASRTIDVAMSDDMRFTPASFSVRRGETIRFVVHNRGAAEHEMVIGTDATLREHAKEMRAMPGMDHTDPNMVRVKPGGDGELTWTFDRAGRFSVACLVPGHYEAGMKGTIVVR